MWPRLLADIWAVISGGQPLPAELEVTGEPGRLPSRLPAEDMAIACTGAALLAAAALRAQHGRPVRAVRLDRGRLAAAYLSERYVRVNGQPAPSGFAPLSRFWPAADGWVRTHANYPWHREALLRALGTTQDAVGTAIAGLAARDVEDRVAAAGGVAAALRTEEQWRAEPPGQAATASPLVGGGRIGDAPPRRREPGPLPASGVRVLDLTRVIAGPVCTRYLAALGADVLRIDPPHHPELASQAIDSLPGKRSALLDFGAHDVHELLDQADVLVHGYRPHALDRFGLSPEAIAGRHPGLVTVSLSAWGATGPWGGRRGFDSLVQVATGIAAAESPDGHRPGVLPCQLLDHGSGYLCAAAALSSLAAQEAEGGTHARYASLVTTSLALLGRSRITPPAAASAVEPELITLPGGVELVPPPGELDGVPLGWDRLPRYGADPAAWSGTSVR